MEPLGTPFLRFEAITKRIGHSSQMSLTSATGWVSRGEFVAIMGASGSGKTTLLSILGLLDRPTAGSYAFDSTDVNTLDETTRNTFRGEKIGFVFQNSFLVPEETAADNVALGLKVRGVRSVARRQAVREALGRVGLESAADKRAGDLSGGEKQRVAVARALVTHPDVILADEPTGALDAVSTQNLIGVLRQINDGGTTIIVVTHDPLVAEAADRTMCIVDGIMQDEPKLCEVRQVPTEETQVAIESSCSGRLAQEFLDAVAAPLNRPLRALLVVLAYLLGVAALVGAMGVTSGTVGQVVARLLEAGSSEIRVMDSSPAESTWEHSLEQAEKLAAMEGMATAVPVRTFTNVGNTVTRLNGMGSSFTGRLIVTDERYFASHGLTTAQGRVDLLSNSWDGPLVVVGAAAADSLGVSEPSRGVQIWVNGRSVDVAATLVPSGDLIADNSLYFSAAAMAYLTDQLDDYTLVHCIPGYAEPLARAIPFVLSPVNPGQITVTVVAQLARLQQGINSDLSRLLTIIGVVILALSALTAGTTMFLSVQHRKPEIALRRAMGTSRGSIWRMYTYEGIAIGCAGGILGTTAGIALTAIITRLNGWPLSLGIDVPLLGLAVGVGAGAIASVIPAVTAARQDPAGILRSV